MKTKEERQNQINVIVYSVASMLAHSRRLIRENGSTAPENRKLAKVCEEILRELVPLVPPDKRDWITNVLKFPTKDRIW